MNKILLLVLMLSFGFGVLSGIPDFKPEPLIIELQVPVSEGVDGMIFEKKNYFIMGESYYADPLQLGVGNVGTSKGLYLEQIELFKFIEYVAQAYRNVRTTEDVMEFSKIENEDIFLSILEEHWYDIKNQYNTLAFFRYRIGWFISPTDVGTLLEIQPIEGDSYSVVMVFTMTTEGWRVKSGYSSNDRFTQDIMKAAYAGKYTSGVVVYGLSKVAREIEEIINLPNLHNGPKSMSNDVSAALSDLSIPLFD